MSNPANLSGELTPAESNLGKVLALIHRVLPRLDDAGRKAEVQTALGQAVSLLEAARAAHSGAAPLAIASGAPMVGPELTAVIAAAVSVALDRPFRLVAVQQVSVPVAPHLNVWSVEGRTQIFLSHKVR